MEAREESAADKGREECPPFKQARTALSRHRQDRQWQLLFQLHLTSQLEVRQPVRVYCMHLRSTQISLGMTRNNSLLDLKQQTTILELQDLLPLRRSDARSRTNRRQSHSGARDHSGGRKTRKHSVGGSAPPPEFKVLLTDCWPGRDSDFKSLHCSPDFADGEAEATDPCQNVMAKFLQWNVRGL